MLAQLVQSAALTGRRSAVRARYVLRSQILLKTAIWKCRSFFMSYPSHLRFPEFFLTKSVYPMFKFTVNSIIREKYQVLFKKAYISITHLTLMF